MHRIATRTLLAACILSATTAVSAQQPLPQPAQPVVQGVQPAPQVPVFQDSVDARQTQDEFRELLRRHPPAVGEVLQRDPSLMTRPDYLAPYPQLQAFLQQHPEIVRNPSFFLGDFRYREPDSREQARRAVNDVLGTFAGLAAGLTAFAVFVWLVRAILDHRRWLRMTRIQTEVHSKLMDRMTSNEDLLAYVQSPAGKRFLESTPITVEGEPMRPGFAPVSRIIYSLQAGVVLIALGVGFWLVQRNVDPDLGEGFFIFGALTFALGVGFAASAFMAYIISTRMGLIAAPGPNRA